MVRKTIIALAMLQMLMIVTADSGEKLSESIDNCVCTTQNESKLKKVNSIASVTVLIEFPRVLEGGWEDPTFVQAPVLCNPFAERLGKDRRTFVPFAFCSSSHEEKPRPSRSAWVKTAGWKVSTNT